MLLKFRLFGWNCRFHWRAFKDLTEYVAGITNKCADGRYILFLDYDDVPEEWIIEEVGYLIEEYRLGNCYLFKSSKQGYHVISTQKRSLRELLQIMRDTSTDDAYTYVSLRRARKVWTLRISEKNGEQPTFIGTIPGYQEGDFSKPHNDVLRKLYNLRIPRAGEDGEKRFLTAHYHIAKN